MITPDGKITANFSLREMIHSPTAVSLKIKNVPKGQRLDNLTELCEKVLQPLRDKLNVPIRVSSGFRNKALNAAVGGAPNSQHRKGEAADIHAQGYTAQQLFDFIIKSDIVYDQLIQEFDEWVHISYKREGENRNEALLATKKDGQTIFTKL